jgi:hypothetical protein
LGILARTLTWGFLILLSEIGTYHFGYILVSGSKNYLMEMTMANKGDWELFCAKFNLTQKQMNALTVKQWERYLEQVRGDQRLTDFIGRNLQRLDDGYMRGCSPNQMY